MLTPEEEARKAKLLKELKDLEDGARARYLDEANKRRYCFADVKTPEDLSMIRRFQHIFGRHIPCLLESEHHSIRLHQQFLDGIFGNPIQTINKSTFEVDLKRFRNAMEKLAEWTIWGTMVYQDVVPTSHEVRDSDDVLRAALEIYDCLLAIDDIANHYNKLPQVLDQLESWAREMSDYLPDRRNIKWEAVTAVDQLRAYWQAYNETSAPRRALNPASPFADYLRDGFEFFKIPGDPISAFKRWVVAEDAQREVRIQKWK